MFGSCIQLYVTHSSHTGSLFLDWPYFVSHNLWLAYNLLFTPLPNQQALAHRLALGQTCWSQLRLGEGREGGEGGGESGGWQSPFSLPMAARFWYAALPCPAPPSTGPSSHCDDTSNTVFVPLAPQGHDDGLRPHSNCPALPCPTLHPLPQVPQITVMTLQILCL